MDVTERFSDRIAAYQQARIGYPPAFVEHLRSHIGLSPVWTVVDAGAGTGLSSAPLLDAGCRVLAVESRQTVGWEGLTARIRSTSYVPAPGAEGHDGMMSEFEALYGEHAEGGEVTIEYRVSMYFGRVS